MTTKIADALSDDDLEQRLRETFAVVVPLVERGETSASRPRRPDRRRLRRLPVAVACGAVVTLGVAGALAVTTRTGDGPDRQAGPQSSDVGGAAAPEDTGPAASTPSAAEVTAGGRSDRADQVQWFLPTALPDGYELTDISAELDVDGTPNPDVGGGVEVVGGQAPPVEIQTWIRRGDDGATNEDTISVTAMRAPTGSTPTVEPAASAALPDSDLIAPANTTVHGVDAVIVGPPLREAPGWTVNWVESEWNVTIQATGGVSQAEAIAVAEGTTVSADGATLDPAALPAGFEAAEPEPSTAELPNRREAVMLVIRAGSHQSIRVRSDSPAMGSLDELSIDETERRTIDGVDYSLFEDDDNVYSRVVWLDQGRQFVADGKVSLADVLAVATGVRPATLAEAVEAAATITATTQALPIVATATLADGVEVSVHGPADDDIGVVGICIDAPEPRCVQPLGITWEVGVPGIAITALFHIDGDRRAIAWNGTRPELSDAETPLPDLVAAATGAGWFIDQLTPAGEPLRSIDYRAGDGSLTGFYPIDDIRP